MRLSATVGLPNMDQIAALRDTSMPALLIDTLVTLLTSGKPLKSWGLNEDEDDFGVNLNIRFRKAKDENKANREYATSSGCFKKKSGYHLWRDRCKMSQLKSSKLDDKEKGRLLSESTPRYFTSCTAVEQVPIANWDGLELEQMYKCHH